MYFPRYWAKGTVKGPGRLGQTLNAEAWGWSDISDADALALATARAQALLAKLPPEKRQAKRAQYYDGRPFREPVLQDLSRGSIKALITRNSFGCEVLNTDAVAFADIDYDPPRTNIFSSLFGGKKKAAAAQAAWEAQKLETLRQGQREHPSWSFRVYRTAGGLRLLVVSGLKIAGSAESVSWLEAVGSDPLYLRLCRDQKSFRARLTPKPWRCAWHQLTVRFPYSGDSERERFNIWLTGYEKRCVNFAVCEFLETVGVDTPASELREIIALHDERTFVGTGRPLA
jgi:hypothetical protein